MKNETHKCLLDTGSNYSLLPLHMIQNAEVKPINLDVSAINGSPINILGSSVVRFTIGTEPATATVLVSDQVQEFVLGHDWLCLQDITWKFRSEEILFRNKKIKLLTKTNSVEIIGANTESQGCSFNIPLTTPEKSRPQGLVTSACSVTYLHQEDWPHPRPKAPAGNAQTRHRKRRRMKSRIEQSRTKLRRLDSGTCLEPKGPDKMPDQLDHKLPELDSIFTKKGPDTRGPDTDIKGPDTRGPDTDIKGPDTEGPDTNFITEGNVTTIASAVPQQQDILVPSLVTSGKKRKPKRYVT